MIEPLPLAPVKQPCGDADDAIQFALTCNDASAFLEQWIMGRADQWPGYLSWWKEQSK